MDCTEMGFTINNDNSDQKLKKAVEHYAKADSSKMMICVGYLNTDEFKEFCFKDPQVIKDAEGKEINNLLDINTNTLSRLIRQYYEARHKSVMNSIARRNADVLDGFSSAKAKAIALDHTANLLITEYYANLARPKDSRLTQIKIIGKVNTKLINDFITKIAEPLLESLKTSRAKKTKEDYENAKKAQEDFINLRNEYNALVTQIKSSKNDTNEERKALLELKKKTREVKLKKVEAENKRYIILSNLVDGYGNIRQKNFNNLVKQVRGNINEWYNKAFVGSKLTNLVREFDELLESDKLKDVNSVDENDVENDNSESIDEMAKNWEDKLYKSFDKAVAADLKLYFNTLYQLNAPVEWGNEDYSYDTNNELGVPMTMGANYIITQLSNYGDFSSLNNFVNSIYKASQRIPSLYGLGQLVNKMINDPIFANYVFTQLANPKMKKTIVIINEDGVEFTQSNKAVEPLTYMLFNMFNSIKDTYRDRYTEYDLIESNRKRTQIGNVRLTNEDFIRYNQAVNYDDFIYNTLLKYFPKLDLKVIRSYLDNGSDKLNNYKQLIADINNLLSTVYRMVNEYGEAYTEYSQILSEYKKRKKENPNFNDPYPTFDISKLDYNKFYSPIISIAKKLSKYDAVKNELNSVNAEGNLASDLGGNNYISNLFKQIKYSTEDNEFAGLEKIKSEIVKGHQYDYSPIYFGVQDTAGRTIIPGLFIKTDNGIIINPEAKNILTDNLFDGVKDKINEKSAMYSSMSKGDYFLTQMIAFRNPIGFGELIKEPINELNNKYAGFFMRTPSDAPKNFIIQAPKYNITGLWKEQSASVTAYIESVKQNIINKYNFTNDDEDDNIGDILIDGKSVNDKSKFKYNFKNAKEIYSILTDEEIENIKYNNKYYIEDKDANKVTIPIIYKTKDSFAVIYLKGDIVVGTSEKIAENLVVDKIVSNEKGMPDDFFIELKDIIKAEGIENGSIVVKTNRDNAIFRGFRTQLFNELNNYIYQLNNIFIKNKNGEWVTRKDTDGLFDRVHFNKTLSSTGKKQFIVEGKYKDSDDLEAKKVNSREGKLSGKFFKFQKLFESNGYNIEEAMESFLSLYGGTDAVFIKTRGGLKLNNNRIYKEEGDNTNAIIKIRNGQIEPVFTKQTEEIIDNIVEEWINNFHKEILNRTKQYSTINNERYTSNEITEAIMNNAIMEMNFDDLFEGDSKYYKNAQDFLKRAKEVQAAGKAYSGFDCNEEFSNSIHPVLDINGKEQIIKVQDSEYNLPVEENGNLNPNGVLKARNGFRAITIYNTVRPSEQAPRIKEELIDILTPQVGKEKAEEIANQIASGYFENTKVNDAQSYITFEEFIARRYADGTLNQYTDIINQIMEVRQGKRKLTDINLKDINARIQVQKNFYFDRKFDENTKTHYVRQIKNAEFVLIPELIKGTELYDLYQIMRKHDIGQVNTIETSKAAKKDILTYWDNDGKVNPDFEKQLTANKSRAIEDFYYRYLYKQQDVPQHLLDEKNKAGIQIMKKILDNANSAVQNDINNFFEAYCANIKEDFNSLINNMGWIVAEDGSLKNAKNPNASLNFDEFYKKARLEAQRLGLDSNFAEYLTPDILGNPKMPNYMNNVSTKLESIAQAIFNSSVTRQTLPGWHAAQVTSVGHGVKIKDSTGQYRTLKYHPSTYINNETKEIITVEAYKELSNKDKANYKLHNEAYAEVMIPKWSKKLMYKPSIKKASETDAQYKARISKEKEEYEKTLLDKLAKEGLDIHIGYRIPTEGKQSVSVLKVVGFLDDVYGSTIMVPDEWVTQTGSDFDVDSVYGICYKMSRDLKKIILDKDESYNGIARRYIRYVNKAIKDRVEKDLITDELKKSKINEIYNSLSDAEKVQENNDKFNELCKASNEAWLKLPNSLKQAIMQVNKEFSSKEDIFDRYIAVAVEAKDYKSKNEKEQANIERFATISETIARFIALTKSESEQFLEEFREAKSEAITKLFEQAKEDYLNKIKAAAKEANLASLEEFGNWSIMEQNSRDARDNALLDSMINIMKNDNSREENYSRSNFDDLTAAMKHMNDLRGASKVLRSAYNPLDQMDFMENAMSGAQLKAFSVTRDTFNSVNNYTKSKLNSEDAIDVEYNTANYSLDEAIAAYGEENILPLNNGVQVGFDDKNITSFVVTHDKFGNSNNNRNIVGKLLTPYSSQTTAHILDAIKEGAIYNENDYTFGTFKTLIDVGIDYNTAIGFLMQPGITRIVEANNAVKSIYINSNSNPIQAAIKSIATDLGITINGEKINTYTQIKKVLNLLNDDKKLQKAFVDIFNTNINPEYSFFDTNFDLNRDKLEHRLKGEEVVNKEDLIPEDKKYRDAAFDLAMIAIFNKVHNTTKRIENLARCSNPDRFGAKQTIRATRETLNNIYKYSYDEEDKTLNTLLVNGEPLLKALYPGLTSENGINVKASAYPYLAAFLKYATIPSVTANMQLFQTESKPYNKITDIVQARLGIKFTDDQYKEYKQYMISDVYGNIKFLYTPLTINEAGIITIDDSRIEKITEGEIKYWDEERSRIFGYDVTQSGYFKPNNINKPKKEEIEQFNKLTPAQKVLWIQENFNENRGIFDFLNVNTFNQYEYKNKGFTSQSIRYNDQIDNIEEIFRAFRDCYYNKNPFIRLATIDLIKYAFVVEGFKFKKGSISKIIPNDTIYSNIEDMGMDIINPIDEYDDNRHGVIDSFNLYKNIEENRTKQFIDKFVRSHAEYTKQVNIPKAKKSKQGNENIGYKFIRHNQGEGIIYIPFDLESKDLLEHLDIKEHDNKPRNYIRINQYIGKKQRKITLYKIVRTNGGIYMYPLNLLERNETFKYSANNKNNIYKSQEYYEALINSALKYNITVKEIVKDEKTHPIIEKEVKDENGVLLEFEHEITLDNLKSKYKIKPHTFTHIIESAQNPNEFQRIINLGSPKESDEVNRFIEDIQEYLETPVERTGSYGVIRSDNRYIASLIPKSTAIIQNIPLGEDVVKMKITRYTPTSEFIKLLFEDPKAKISKVKQEELTALNKCLAAGDVRPTLYKVQRVLDADIKKEQEEAEKLYDENIETMFAISSDIEDIDVDISMNFDDSEVVAKELFNELDKRANSMEDSAAAKAIRRLNIVSLDADSSRSIHEHKRSIYTAAAEYYVAKAHTLLDRINNFVSSTGELYSLDDANLYKHLINHPEDYPLLVETILEAKTFGGQFYDIFKLDVTSEDEETKIAIDKIKKAVNEVRNNTKLRGTRNHPGAIELLFNDYLANNYSTNPIIRQGLIELRTAFGDTDWFDLNFSDIGELNNKQVQTVVKYVYAILDEANDIIAPKAVNTFTKQFEDIMNMPGNFNWDNIITSEGKFIAKYTSKFLEDREVVTKAVKNAKETYGEDSIQYIKAKLARDKWRADNVEQNVDRSYYTADVNLREQVLSKAQNEYVEYMKLIHELYSDTRAFNTLSKEEKDRRKELNHKIARLTSDFKDDNTLKSDEEQFRANALRQYIEEKRKLNAEYFEFNETEGFKNNLEYYTKIIKNYEERHPNEYIDDRLQNPEYKEAYDWIQANTIYTLDEKSKVKILDAFKVLKSEDQTNSNFIKKILKVADAYDEYGNIDPRKLDDDQIEAIRNKTKSKFSDEYDSNAGEAILIRDIPKGLPVLKNEFYRMLRDPSENEKGVNPRRLQTIKRINELIAKGVNAKSGAIESSRLFDSLTEEELKELAELYGTLRNIKGNRKSKELRKKFKEQVEFLNYDEAYDREKAWALANLRGTSLYDLWSDIFEEYSEHEDKIVPNSNIFGYILPKDKTYIDEKKTKARKIIEEDIQFIPTEYYIAASNQASKEGRFEEWYKLNHVFNPYTHKMEPLKIWTKMTVNPNGNLKGKYSYVPTYENKERNVKDKYINKKYKNYSTNYNTENGHYNNRTSLSKKEEEMLTFLQSTINSYATSHQMKKFAEDGYLPRRMKVTPDTKWYLNQALGATGLEFRNTGEHKWSEIIDYTRDFDADFDMMSIIKQKGYKPVPERPKMGSTQTEEEYAKEIEEWEKEKKAIEAENLRLDNEVLDRDWKSVMQDFIAKATDYQAKQKVKNTIYLLLEDIKDNDAYAISRYSGKVLKDTKLSTKEVEKYKTVKQNNTYELVQNWARRVLYNEFKKNSGFTKWADLMQNVTSAKYMIFNVTGGIANVGTGMANIMNEVFAKEYFDINTYTKAINLYRQNSLSMIADMYSPTSDNLYVAITKLFNIVDFDAFNERRPNESATEYVKRIRDGLYAFQSGGEHYMQNSVLFAMLDSHRLFKDVDGTMRIGSFSEYVWKLETTTLMNLLKNNDDYLDRYLHFLKEVKDDANEIKKYDTFSRDLNEEFLRDLGDKKVINEFIIERDKAYKQAKKEFYSDANPTFMSMFELKDGYAVLKEGIELPKFAYGNFKNKVISVNKKIHGVYDKIGAAKIEAEWWGSLVMQYHKHLYPGIMKRYRIKGYYNELRNSIERGSHISLAKLATTEFRGISKRIDNKADDENIAIKSIEEITKSIVNTVINLKMNWNLLPEWERNNIKRNLGDLYGVVSAMMTAMAIYGITDDDDTKDSELLASMLYISDRLMTEAQMYTPWGVVTEAKTLWSSPIAAQNGPKDLMKAIGIASQWLYDDNYNMDYSTGLYKGQNKLAVLLYRNTPIYRVYQRLANMTKNNSYYRINETALNLKLAKIVADTINPD